MKQGIEAFLAIGFDLENARPASTERAAREDAMRILGFTQAQEQLRSFLEQCHSSTAQDLARAPHHPQALRPHMVGDRRLWMAPELPVKKRRR
jgi:hypothetical protein